jgi:hypothetical protein
MYLSKDKLALGNGCLTIPTFLSGQRGAESAFGVEECVSYAFASLSYVK